MEYGVDGDVLGPPAPIHSGTETTDGSQEVPDQIGIADSPER